MDNEILEIIYSLLEDKYIKKFGEGKTDIFDLLADGIFPENWFSWNNVAKKIELLSDAIENNKIICDFEEIIEDSYKTLNK